MALSRPEVLIESVRIAFAQIRANAMRSILTALGVIIGIVAVTLMGTAMRGIDLFKDVPENAIKLEQNNFGDNLAKNRA